VKSSTKSKSVKNLKEKVLRDVDNKMIKKIVDEYGN